MRALVIAEFGVPPQVREVPDPVARPGGVVIKVEATGLCRSDWHAFAGHDPDVELPHVPGHEFAGTVHAVGAGVPDLRIGDRVTAPFVLACFACAPCAAGDQQVCTNQWQPGFTGWGSFAEFLELPRATGNLVRLPDTVQTTSAAVLGCRFGTAYRALTAVGRLRAGEWVAVHGCGGVGLSAVMIAVAAGARVVAVDVSAGALRQASRFGAEAVVDAAGCADWAEVALAVTDVTGGGAQLSMDAVGSVATASASLAGLRPRGRHVQVGLLPPALGPAALPLHLLVAGELELLGSHGMPAHAYPALLGLVAAGRLPIEELVVDVLTLEQAGPALAAAGSASPAGVRVIRPWLPAGGGTPRPAAG